MAQPRLGTFLFLGATGDIPAWAYQTETRERAGVDGYTFVRLGKRSQPFQWRTRTTATSLAAAQSLAEAYDNLSGQFVSLRDGAGRTYGRVYVHSVKTAVAVLGLSTDGGTHMITADWTLQRTG